MDTVQIQLDRCSHELRLTWVSDSHTACHQTLNDMSAACDRLVSSHLLLLLLGASDVRVRPQQDVLQLRLLLVDVLDSLPGAASAARVSRRPQGGFRLGSGRLWLCGWLGCYCLRLRALGMLDVRQGSGR